MVTCLCMFEIVKASKARSLGCRPFRLATIVLGGTYIAASVMIGGLLAEKILSDTALGDV